jgi:hypothetical protein
MICYYLPFCFGHEAVIGERQDGGCQGIGLCIVNTDINSPNDQSRDIQFQVRFMAYDVDVWLLINIYIYIGIKRWPYLNSNTFGLLDPTNG